jgi:hypothetical protein
MLISVKIIKKFFFQNLTRKFGFFERGMKKNRKKNEFSNFEKSHIDSYVKFHADSRKNNEKILFLNFDPESRVF